MEVQEKYKFSGELKMITGDIKRAWEIITHTHTIKISGRESIHLTFRSSQWCSWGFCCPGI